MKCFTGHYGLQKCLSLVSLPRAGSPVEGHILASLTINENRFNNSIIELLGNYNKNLEDMMHVDLGVMEISETLSQKRQCLNGTFERWVEFQQENR